MKSPATKAAALQMIREGAYPRDVARTHGVSVICVRNWCRKTGATFKLRTRGRPRTPVGIRKMAAAIVAGGASLAEAAARMEMSTSTILTFCQEFGVVACRPRGRKKGTPASNRRPEWANVEWERNDKELARELNVTQQRG